MRIYREDKHIELPSRAAVRWKLYHVIWTVLGWARQHWWHYEKWMNLTWNSTWRGSAKRKNIEPCKVRTPKEIGEYKEWHQALMSRLEKEWNARRASS